MNPLVSFLCAVFFAGHVLSFELPPDLSNLNDLNKACKNIPEAPTGFIELLRNNPNLASWANQHTGGEAWNKIFVQELKSYWRLACRHPQFFSSMYQWVVAFDEFRRFPNCQKILSFLGSYPGFSQALATCMSNASPGNSFILQIMGNLEAIEEVITQSDAAIYTSMLNQLSVSVEEIHGVNMWLMNQSLHRMGAAINRYWLENPLHPDYYLNIIRALQNLIRDAPSFLLQLAHSPDCISALFDFTAINPELTSVITSLCQVVPVPATTISHSTAASNGEFILYRVENLIEMRRGFIYHCYLMFLLINIIVNPHPKT